MSFDGLQPLCALFKLVKALLIVLKYLRSLALSKPEGLEYVDSMHGKYLPKISNEIVLFNFQLTEGEIGTDL